MIKSIGVLKEKINQAENAPSRIANLQEQIAKWDQSLLTSVSNKAINLRIFDEVSQTSQKLNVQVKGMRCLGSKVEKNIVVDTYEILFSSDYKSLVKVLHHLENNMKYGFVSSATFELMKNQEKQRNDLVLRLFIQTMVNN